MNATAVRRAESEPVESKPESGRGITTESEDTKEDAEEFHPSRDELDVAKHQVKP